MLNCQHYGSKLDYCQDSNQPTSSPQSFLMPMWKETCKAKTVSFQQWTHHTTAAKNRPLHHCLEPPLLWANLCSWFFRTLVGKEQCLSFPDSVKHHHTDQTQIAPLPIQTWCLPLLLHQVYGVSQRSFDMPHSCLVDTGDQHILDASI